MRRKPKTKSLKCAVCESLAWDNDWVKTANGDLQRGPFRVNPEQGTIEQDGVLVPLSWAQRRCVRKCVRIRAEKRFRNNGWTKAT